MDDDELIDKIYDSDIRKLIRDGKTRRDFASVAMRIAQDRYNGGSLGARAALAIAIGHGFLTAAEFADDLEHHEH